MVHGASKAKAHGVRQKTVIVMVLLVARERLHCRGMFSVSKTHHVNWCVILQLCLVVVLLVVLVTLHLSHLHVVNQQGIVLEAAEANVVALCLLISLLILDLEVRGHNSAVII